MAVNLEKEIFPFNLFRSVLRIENGAYTSVREYFNLRGNAAIGP
jgi:hypothetical protein